MWEKTDFENVFQNPDIFFIETFPILTQFNINFKVYYIHFLAYFQILKKYAIVRTLSVRTSEMLLLCGGLTDHVLLWFNR
jgi:hypothetical protein